MIVLFSFQVPYPPALNRYWRHVGGRPILSAPGRAYRAALVKLLADQRRGPTLTGRLAVEIVACAPDRRRRDLDNVPKALLDGLKHAGVYADDSQIDELRITRGPVQKGGCAWVLLVPARPIDPIIPEETPCKPPSAPTTSATSTTASPAASSTGPSPRPSPTSTTAAMTASPAR